MNPFKHTGRAIQWLIAGTLAALLVATFVTFAGGYWQRWTAGLRGETGRIERVKADPDYRIAAYEHFFDLCSEIQAKGDAIEQQEKMLANASTARDEQVARTNLSALRSTRAQLIRQYNTDAAKNYTQGQFRDSDLPYRIDIDIEDVTCASK